MVMVRMDRVVTVGMTRLIVPGGMFVSGADGVRRRVVAIVPDEHVELRRADPGTIDPREGEVRRGGEIGERQLCELGPEVVEVDAKIDERTDRHVAADPRKTVKIKGFHDAHRHFESLMVTESARANPKTFRPGNFPKRYGPDTFGKAPDGNPILRPTGN
jgi:hypothetical protein